MNLSELIHRPSEDGQSVVASSYDSFQRSPTDAMHLDSIYNKVGSDLMESRFATDHHHHQHQHLIHDAYANNTRLMTTTTSSSNSSSGSPHWQFAPPESSRSPYASTLSDQSMSDPLRPTSDLRAGSNSNSGSNGSGSSSSNGGGGGGGGASTTTAARGPSSNSPVSPVPLDNTSVDHFRKRRLSVNDSSTTGSSYNTFSPENDHRPGETSADPPPSSSSSSSIAATTTNSTSSQHPPSKGIAGLYGRKDMTLNISGQNVSKDNIEEGYVQFIWHNDPSHIGDSIENLMYVKRKFSSVPKTGDLAYTTWDVFQLVRKLHNNEIKNWSQLVGRLGLADVPGRPQFAQRVKRWMRKYRIDCYFDYLLGNPYNFNAGPNDEYTGCLVMGNYQKRRGNRAIAANTATTAALAPAPGSAVDDADVSRSTDESSSTAQAVGSAATAAPRSGLRKRHKYHDDDENKEDSADTNEQDEEHPTEDDDDRSTTAARRTPIAHAGSRKRARHSRMTRAGDEQQQQQLAAGVVDDDGDEAMAMVAAGDGSSSHMTEEEQGGVYPSEDVHHRDDEEDELASSTSSSPASSPAASSPELPHEPSKRSASPAAAAAAAVATAVIAPCSSPPPSPKQDTLPTAGPSDASHHSLLPLPPSSSSPPPPPLLPPPPPPPQSSTHPPSLCSPCHSCTRLHNTVGSLQDDIAQLKHQLSAVQAQLSAECDAKEAMAHRIDRLSAHYDKWRTRLAEQLLQSPFAAAADE